MKAGSASSADSTGTFRPTHSRRLRRRGASLLEVPFAGLAAGERGVEDRLVPELREVPQAGEGLQASLHAVEILVDLGALFGEFRRLAGFLRGTQEQVAGAGPGLVLLGLLSTKDLLIDAFPGGSVALLFLRLVQAVGREGAQRWPGRAGRGRRRPPAGGAPT